MKTSKFAVAKENHLHQYIWAKKNKSQFLLHANYPTFWDLHKVACVFRGLQRLIEPILLSLNFKHTP